MESFKSFFEQQAFVEKVLLEFDQPKLANPHGTWSAKRDEILQMWQKLDNNLPIQITPMQSVPGMNNRSYGQDGVRITGSWPFIASVLGRLKELLSAENQETKLKLSFRATEPDRGIPGQQSFVFYLNAEPRNQPKPII